MQSLLFSHSHHTTACLSAKGHRRDGHDDQERKKGKLDKGLAKEAKVGGRKPRVEERDRSANDETDLIDVIALIANVIKVDPIDLFHEIEGGINAFLETIRERFDAREDELLELCLFLLHRDAL